MTYIIEIVHSIPLLPRRVGPFTTRREAEAWMQDNATDGQWTVLSLTSPAHVAETEPVVKP